METRKCNRCGKVLPLTNECFMPKKNDELGKSCIKCVEYAREYRKTEKGKLRKQRELERRKQKRLLNKKPCIKKTKENGYMRCYVCGESFLFTADNFFTKNNKLISRCISCTDDSEAYIKLKDKWDQRYNEIKDTDEFKKRGKKYRADNRDKIREKQNQYLKDHPEIRKKQRARYIATENGYRKTREKERRKDQRRRARKKGLESSLTAQQWEDCKSFFNYTCAYCGKEVDALTQDHFIAVKNDGEYSRDNIIPVCHSCNSSKRDKDFFEWYPQQEFYSKMREKRIIKYLNYQAEGIQQRTLLG